MESPSKISTPDALLMSALRAASPNGVATAGKYDKEKIPELGIALITTPPEASLIFQIRPSVVEKPSFLSLGTRVSHSACESGLPAMTLRYTLKSSEDVSRRSP